ncbi:excalibur calcium-binding domain-containing protein [Corynebacterium mastitidis]|uniref:excalibur calcium-binding domain-containing protein n=1 Tax=Corynebacterium mastitidis TaxID=161890 RepID=UPI00254CE61C|nr:excalibur calcium-binding domain-containing protein [Corynebacterium mastitidis]MDK8449704.1 excalibur calcium-binding domain-containing protein [Corynebacterium mastitidis]
MRLRWQRRSLGHHLGSPHLHDKGHHHLRDDDAPVEAQEAPEQDTYFASCSEAPGPLLPHQAGYRSGLDSDGDGVACEPDKRNIADASTGPSGGYESCKAAREAGATPLREGDPGYNPDLDKDGDGVACER